MPHFVQRMNQEAQALGMKDTHFSNPAGITMPDHYTTAHDLSLLSQAVIHQTLNIYIIRKCRALATINVFTMRRTLRSNMIHL